MARYKSVLLVDDDEDANFLHSEILKSADFCEKIYEVYNGLEAWEFLTQRRGDEGYFPPNVIFLDIFMPVMDGFEFLERYQELPQDIQASITLVILSSSMDKRDRERAEAFGDVKSYLTKPLRKEIKI